MRGHRSDSTDGLVAAAAAAGSIAPASSSSPRLTAITVNGNTGSGADHAPAADGFTVTVATHGGTPNRAANGGIAAAASGDSTPMLQQQDDSAATTGLLQRFDVMPTGSRLLQGLRDVAMLVVVVIPFLVLRAARYILVWLGITEHRWKGASTQEPLSREEKQQLGDVVIMLRSNKLPDAVLRQAVSGVSSGTDIRPGTRMLAHLSAVTTAMEQVAHTLELNYDPVSQQGYFNKLADVMERFSAGDEVDPLDVLKSLRRHSKHFVKRLAEQAQQRGGSKAKQQSRQPSRAVDMFVFKLLMENSRAQPPVLKRVAMHLPEGRQLVEVLTLIPLDLGIEFLQTQGPRFAQQVEFMSQYNLMRPSDAKKRPEVQAMTINARVHSLQLQLPDGSSQPVASVLRSGGFATHGRKPRRMGLAALKEMADYCQLREVAPALHSAVLSEAGFSSLQELQEEIEARKGCVIAQALPVVVRGIRDMLSRRDSLECAVRAGSFLYVQHSLLSDTNPREGAYLQDLKGALDELSQRIQIRFVFKPARRVEVQGRHIVLFFDRDEVTDAVLPAGVTKEELLSRTYSLTALVFNCGVNILQSLGFFLPAAQGMLTQDLCNRQAMERLNDYARQAGLSSTPALLALNRHYSPGTPRAAKDVEAVWLVRGAVRELGGVRGINCKSGKDRTAMEIALSFTQEAARQLQLSAPQQEVLLEALQGGLSYVSTSQNNGRPSAYAFTEFELVTMPPGWSPAWKLCGKVDT